MVTSPNNGISLPNYYYNSAKSLAQYSNIIESYFIDLIYYIAGTSVRHQGKCDSICDQIDVINFCCFWNELLPTKHISKKGWYQIHARTLFITDCLEKNCHQIWMDNLYLTEQRFVKGSYNLPNSNTLLRRCLLKR